MEFENPSAAPAGREEKKIKNQLSRQDLEKMKEEIDLLAKGDDTKNHHLFNRAKKIYELNPNIEMVIRQIKDEEENPVESKIEFVS